MTVESCAYHGTTIMAINATILSWDCQKLDTRAGEKPRILISAASGEINSQLTPVLIQEPTGAKFGGDRCVPAFDTTGPVNRHCQRLAPATIL